MPQLVWGGTYLHDFSLAKSPFKNEAKNTYVQTAVLSSLLWTMKTDEAACYVWINANGCLQIGTEKSPSGNFTLSTDAFCCDTITSVRVYCSKAQNSTAKLSVYVGNDSLGTTKSLYSTKKVLEFKNDTGLSGKLVLSFNNPVSTKESTAVWIKYISVTYSSGTVILDGANHSDSAAIGVLTDSTLVNVNLKRAFNVGFSTICLPFTTTAAAIGASAYTPNRYSNDTLSVVEIDTLKANTPYLLHFDTIPKDPLTFEDVVITLPSDITAMSTVVSSQSATATLHGVYVSTKMASGDYFFTNNHFYRATEASQSVKPFRAYITFSGSSSAKNVAIGINGPTSISTVLPGVDHKTSAIYDLNGRRLNSIPTRKGIYIINRKKIINE